MEFKARIWRSYYDQVNILGQYLKDSQLHTQGKTTKFTISPEEREKVEKEIQDLLKRSNEYLNKCGLYPKEAKWLFNIKDERTWVSSENFKFKHLISDPKHMAVPIKI